MRGLKYLPAVFLMLVSLDGSALAQFFGKCRTGSQEELSLNIKAHAEHTYRMEAKFLHEYYLQGPLHSELQAPTIDDVQKYLHNLGEGRAAVLFYAYDQQNENLCTWLISKQEITSHRAKVNKEVIQNLQPRLLNELGVTSRARSRIPTRKGGKGPGFSTQKAKVTSENLVGQATGVLLPPPIAGILPQKSIDTIIVVPIFQFGTIPFSVLNIGGKPLVETTSVLIAPGFDVFKDGQRATPADFSQSVIVGDPAYDDPQWNLKPLPGARAEAEEVGRIVGSSPLIGEDANIGTIKRLIEKDRKNPGLIYLATHGRADTENPLDGSWIWLSPEDNRYGRWAPREIQNLPLKKGRPLVVLSACQTGLGKNFGVGTIGMARAWHRAGASSVAMSLWSVSDNATRSLMTRFVRLATEIPPDKALREAMLETRKEFPEPFNWAGFTVFGLPSRPPELLTLGPSKGAPPSTGTPPGIPVIDDPTRTPEPKRPQILWNLWAEKKDAPNEKPLFNPVSHLEQGKYYLVTIDLSGISYKEYTRSVGTGLDNAIRRWIKEKEPEVDLTAVMLVDPLHFEAPDGGNVRILKVDLGKIDRFANPDNVVHDNVFLFLKQKAEQKADPDFVFGRVAFRVKTRTGQAGGPASISLSLWVNNRPIDEISVKLCIAPESGEPSCSGIAESQFGLRGVDSLRIASDKSPFPDAALHFLELGSEGVFGVFHRNDNTSINDNTLKSKYLTWRLKKSPEILISDLSNWVQAFVATGSDNTDLLNRGVGLYNLLFTSDDPEAKEALSAWQEFIRPQLVRDASATDYRPPSIFVRLIQQGPDPPLLVPLGLAAVSLDNKPATFLGYHFRIETPLEIQAYRSDNNCLSRWVTVVPEGEATLAKATSRMGEKVGIWRERSAKSFKSVWEFGDWIRQDQIEASPTALIILSHHAKDRIFADSKDLLTSGEVKRMFPGPSVVVLSGCGTGGPGAVGFLRQFNRNGIGTVIATSTEVDPYMAGDFLNEFDDVLKDNEKEKWFTLADAYFRTVQRMREKNPPDHHVPYGARALEFVLVGNGNIRLCPPKK